MISVRRACVVLAAVLTWLPQAAAAADEFSVERFELPPPMAGGDFGVEIMPSRLLLGTGGESLLTAVLPVGARDVRVLAARGFIDDVAVEKGRARARYSPPDAFAPRLDVIAVIVDVEGETRFGFATVQLLGQGRAEIRTRPMAEAVIDIRGARFGPVKADRRGRATIQVVVPPGTPAGVDGEGRGVDLGIPPTGRIFAFAADRESAVGGGGTAIIAVVTAPDGGVPTSEEEPTTIVSTVSTGTLASVDAGTDGVSRFRYLPLEAISEEGDPGRQVVTIEFGLPGEEESTARVDIGLSPREPAPLVEPIPGEDEPIHDGPAFSRFGLGPKLGYATNLGSLHGVAVAVEFGFELPLLDGGFRALLEPGLVWSGASDSVRTDQATRADVGASTWIIPVTLGLSWRVPLMSNPKLAVAAQGGGALLINRVGIDDGPAGEIVSRERAGAPAVGGALGASWSAGLGEALLEVRYLWLGGELESLRGRLSLLLVSLGYRFDP